MEMTERTQKSIKRQRKVRQDEVEIKQKRIRKAEHQKSKSTKSLVESKKSKMPAKATAKKVPQNPQNKLKSDQRSRKSDDASSHTSKRTARSSTRPLNPRSTSRTAFSSHSNQRETNDTLIDIKNHQKKNDQVHQCEPKKLIRILVLSSAAGFLLTVIFLIYIWLS